MDYTIHFSWLQYKIKAGVPRWPSWLSIWLLFFGLTSRGHSHELEPHSGACLAFSPSHSASLSFSPSCSRNKQKKTPNNNKKLNNCRAPSMEARVMSGNIFPIFSFPRVISDSTHQVEIFRAGNFITQEISREKPTHYAKTMTGIKITVSLYRGFS